MRPALLKWMVIMAALASLETLARAAPVPKDAKAIEACIATATPSRRDACIGIVANPCLDADTGTTAGMNGCLDREYVIWDAWLNRDYALYRNKLAEDGKALLKEVEQLFIALKDKRCAFDYAVNGGGTMYSTTNAQCRMDETARQWIWVRAHLDEMNGN